MNLRPLGYEELRQDGSKAIQVVVVPSSGQGYYFSGRIDTSAMSTARTPKLEPDRVYRTRDFATWTKNTPRFARRLERAGVLQRLGHGLFVHPRVGRFGVVPPSDAELLRGF